MNKKRQKVYSQILPSKKIYIFYIIFIFTIGLLIYTNSFQNQFVWDDEFLIKNNPAIQNWSYSNIKKIFTKRLFYETGQYSNFYRPVQSISLLCDYSIWKLNPVGYHITNTLLHLINAILIYYLLRQLINNDVFAFLGALLFEVHPIYTSAVTYISGRADPLSTLFMLMCLLLFIRYVKSRRWISYILLMLCFILALLSKESALIFPFILFSYYFLFINKRKKEIFGMCIMPTFLISLVYALLRMTIMNFSNKPLFESSLSFITRLLLACKVLTKYLMLYIVPLNLHMERIISIPKSILEPNILFSIALVLLLLSLFMLPKNKAHKYKVTLFGILWFFICLIPVSNIFPLNAYIAEHWLYVPSIGLIILASIGIDKLAKLYRKKIVMICIIPISVVYAFLTINQNNYWKDELTFYQKTLYYNPNSSRAHYNLGNTYSDKGWTAKAIQEYEEAIRLKPNYIDTYCNLGNLYREEGLYDKAIETYQKALTIEPDDFRIHNNLALTFLKNGLKDKAISEYKEVLRINPAYAEGYSNTGSIYFEKGLYDEAIKMLKKAIELNPNLINAHDVLGIIYNQLGHFDQAIVEFKNVLQLDPTRIATYNDLGILFANQGQFKQAREMWERALQLDPSFGTVINNLKKLEEMGY